MKANELRIGNLIEYNGEEQTICSFGYNKTTDEYRIHTFEEAGYILLDDISPVTLSEYWLHKFGFENDPDCGYIKSDGISPGSYWEIHLMMSGKYVLTHEDVDCRMDGVIEIEFVHQLQNAWFAITGVELTLTNK